MTAKNILLSLFLCVASAVWAQQQVTPTLYKNTDKAEMTRWVDSVYAQMDTDEKIGQLFMPIVESTAAWRTRTAGYINNQKVGGLLFSKGTLAQQAEATNYAQSIAKTPLLISLDGEWGLSMRLTDAPVFPRNQIIGAIHNEEIIRLYGREVARQCREMGIHVNFAPTIDVHSNPANPVIGTRSFGEKPQNVAMQGIAYAKGLEEGGVMAVAKHFPGHGDTSEDSHKTQPTINHSRQRLETNELPPFREYVAAGLSGMMIGHLNVPALNTRGLPASLSPSVGTDLLQKEMGFSGLVFTDGMGMQGVANQPDMSIKALLAGNDIILGAINTEREFNAVKKAVENGTISAQMLEEKVRKILSYKYILQVHTSKPIATRGLGARINTSETRHVQQKIYDGALTLIKNQDSLLPLRRLDQLKIASVAIGAGTGNAFQKYLRKYANVTTIQAASAAAIPSAQLKDFDAVIFSVHAGNTADAVAMQQFARDKKSILVLFTSPYRLGSLSNTIGNADAVLVAYDNSDFAQSAAAQGIFGGIGIGGKLPVSTGNFDVNTGIDTKKIRLGYAQPEEVGISSERLANIERIANEGVRQRAYPGCQILVAKDGVVIYERAFGRFDYSAASSAVTDETVYDLASITKVSATLPAVMKLYDEKKIRLQDAISQFVPQTKGSDKAHIHIRALLLHESGITPFIPYYTSAIDPNSFSGSLFGSRSATFHARYAGAWGRTDYKFLPNLVSTQKTDKFYRPVANSLYASDEMHSVLLKDVIDSKLRTRGRYAYSCLNFMLLKEAVENIADTDLNSYVRQNFFDKLGAVSTTFLPLNYMTADLIPPTENDPFFRKQHLRGYVHDEGAALFGGISGNAGLFSNANDLAKLCQMWLNGGKYGDERFLSEETVRLFTTTKSSVSRRGLGFDKPDLRNNNASPTSPGTPITVYGHTGYTGTCFWVDPTNNMIYIFLSNRVNPERSPNRLSTLKIRERIQQELYNAIAPANTSSF